MKLNHTSSWVTVVFVAILIEGSSSAQCQRQKLLASDTGGSDHFGWSVAISSDWVAAGAYGESSIAGGSGAVYMFHRDPSGWVQTQKLKASDAAYGAAFGMAVALDGNTLAVGAPGDSYNGFPIAGAVYIFDLSGSTWTQTVKLHSGDPGEDEFGNPIAIEGDRLLIAARYDDGPSTDSGAAYIFDRVGGTWSQTQKLVGHDFAFNYGIGLNVALLGDRALLGVPYAGTPGAARGEGYVFERQANGWIETQTLLGGDVSPGDQFGSGVALTGDFAVLGAPGHRVNGTQPGMAYVFQKTSSGWVLAQEFIADDTSSGDQFGEQMTASAEHLIIGSDFDQYGCAYDYRLLGSNWTQVGKLLASQVPSNGYGSLFGFALAISGETVLAGDPADFTNCPPNLPLCAAGAAYIHELAPTATQYGHCASNSPCNNPEAHGGCQNSTGQGAMLAACGSGSVTTDDLEIQVTHCPPHKSTLLFMGGIQVHAPYDDGIRVVGGGAPGIYRFGIVQSDDQGFVGRGPGLVAQSQTFHTAGRIQPGQSWNFQIWYRDPPGPCGGLANFSNGVQVVFAP